MTTEPAGGRVLLVDDDLMLLRSLARALRAKGFEVTAANDGAEAVRQSRETVFDVIVSDISMPSMDGIQLLARIREHDAQVPVVLITGEPTVSTALKAIEYGVFHYLTKPAAMEDVQRVITKAVAMSRMARAKQEAATALGRLDALAADRAGLEASFRRAIDLLWIAYQPIVHAGSLDVYGYEALMRSEEPTLPHPGAMLEAAERLDRMPALSRAVRERAGVPMGGAPTPQSLFVNCHPTDLLDEEMYDPGSALAAIAPRVVLEITERSGLEKLNDVRARVLRLRELGFRIAVDDFGAGYAGLTSFAQLEPDVVKLDLSIVRDVERTPVKQKLIRSVTALAADLGILVVGEGVETPAERDCLVELGCDLLQGYLFARPGRPFPTVVR